MGHWQNEDDIKAELRMLTKELRQLREELRSMITPPRRHTRALLYRPPSPPSVPEPPVAEAADKSDPPPRSHQKK